MAEHEGKNPSLLAALAAFWKAAKQSDFVRQGAAELGAAGIQGRDELAAVLKAFPESIQAEKPAAEFEAANAEQNRSPSEIAEGRTGIHGQEKDGRPLRSPSEIAEDRGVHGKETSFVEQERQRQLGGENTSDGNEQNERGRGRSLADEQRERDYDRGR